MIVKAALAALSLGVLAGCAERCAEPRVAPVVEKKAIVAYECEPQCTQIHEHKTVHHAKKPCAKKHKAKKRVVKKVAPKKANC